VPACEATAAAPTAAGPTAAGQTSAAPPAAANTVAAPADPNVHEVTSPLLGTFYRAPKPGASPFVEVGSQVEEGTVVAIIEVMKLMNTVRAGVRGTVTEILVADGALAEYGETLLRVRKAG
jgi:acetyl-CoA carboxylase biotin carboxyl carrier protein